MNLFLVDKILKEVTQLKMLDLIIHVLEMIELIVEITKQIV